MYNKLYNGTLINVGVTVRVNVKKYVKSETSSDYSAVNL